MCLILERDLIRAKKPWRVYRMKGLYTNNLNISLEIKNGKGTRRGNRKVYRQTV